MTETLERREAIARIIDPAAWTNVDAMRKDFPADPWERFLAMPIVAPSLAKADAILALSLPAREVRGERLPRTCDGIEQDAFEAWAEANHFDMHQHPLHWLFLNPETSAARKGWRAGLEHAVDRIKAALATTPAPRGKLEADLDAIRREVVKLYCASGCSCCRDDEKWFEASAALGKLFDIPEYHDGSGHDWYAARDELATLNRLSGEG